MNRNVKDIRVSEDWTIYIFSIEMRFGWPGCVHSL